MHWRQVDLMRAWTGMAPTSSCRHTAGEESPLIPHHIMYFFEFVTCISPYSVNHISLFPQTVFLIL